MDPIQTRNEIRALSAEDVARMLEKNGFPECEQMIIQNRIDGEKLLHLTEFSLRTMRHNLESGVLKRLWMFISKVKEDPNLLFGVRKKSTVKSMVQNLERISIRRSRTLSSDHSEESDGKRDSQKLHRTLKSGKSKEELKSSHVPSLDVSHKLHQTLKSSTSEEELKITPDFSSSKEHHEKLTKARKTSQEKLMDDGFVSTRNSHNLHGTLKTGKSEEGLKSTHVPSLDVDHKTLKCSTSEEELKITAPESFMEHYDKLTNSRKTSQKELMDDPIEAAADNNKDAVFTNMDTNKNFQIEDNDLAKKNNTANIDDLEEEANRSGQCTTQVLIEDSDNEEYDVLGRLDDSTSSNDVRNVQVMTPRYAPSPIPPNISSMPKVPEKSRRREEIIPRSLDLYELNKSQITSHSCFVQYKKEDSERLLAKEQNGSYLIRPSEKFGFVLVVKSKQKCYNIPLKVEKTFNLRQQGQGEDEAGFEKFDDLLMHYTNNKIILQGGSLKLRKQNFLV